MLASDVRKKYLVTIGIECHVQLATKTKLFSSSDNDARDKSPNSVVNPIDYGLPGMLPVLNHEAIRLAVRAGKALNAGVAEVSRFDRKHYFYPDLPKGYQTTQMYHPIILAGHIDAPLDGGSSVRVRIHHAHLEEDAGKLTHFEDYSLVDLNRAGTPLIEIVSEPDMHSASEARAYANELYLTMKYAGVTRGDLYHGNMRFDVNVSVAPNDATGLGNRAEVKNLNSFRSVQRAAEYEFDRQVALLEKGERIVQETRGWDDAKQLTTSQRSKEDAQDYRYMPDADIPPVVLTKADIEEMQADMPLLPATYRQQFHELQLDSSVVNRLLDNQNQARLISHTMATTTPENTKRIANWFGSAIDSEDDDTPVSNFTSAHYIELADMVAANELSSTAAKEVFNHLLTHEVSPRNYAEENGLLQESDESAVAAIVDEVLAAPESQQSVDDIKAGKDKAIGFLVGQVMKRSAGKANPALAQKLIRERLGN